MTLRRSYIAFFTPATCLTLVLLKTIASLVKLGNSSRTSTYEPLLSRRYGYILLGRYVVELELSKTLRLVAFKFYVESAVGLLQQVGGGGGEG